MNIQRMAKLLQGREQVIRETILDTAQKEKLVLFGARGYNIQVPQKLRKETSDYDLLAKKPKKTAKKIADILKRRLDEDISISKGSHKGTWRIKTESGEVIGDITQLKNKPKTKKVWGIEARSIPSIKRNVQRIIKKPGTEFRREKDLDTLARIKRIENIDKAFNF
jgi:hypothetical protein